MCRKSSVKAFTLIEVLFATVLIGLAISALMAANGAFSLVNKAGLDLSTAEYLIEQIREQSAKTSFSSLLTMEASSPYNPPIDAEGNQLSDFSDYTQQVTVQNVSGTNFQSVQSDGSTDFIRVHVAVTLNGTIVNETSWIRSNY